MGAFKDLTGLKFSRLTVIRRIGTKHTSPLWECECICGNITEAAKELYITQPALSMYINSLEITMGVKLFKRIKNKYVLTYIGEKYVEKAKEMLKLQSEFKSQLDEVIGGYDNRVRIGVQMRRSPYVVASMLLFKVDLADTDVSEYETKKEKVIEDRNKLLDEIDADTTIDITEKKRKRARASVHFPATRDLIIYRRTSRSDQENIAPVGHVTSCENVV